MKHLLWEWKNSNPAQVSSYPLREAAFRRGIIWQWRIQLWSPNLQSLVAACIHYIHYIYCELNPAVNTNPKYFIDRDSAVGAWGLRGAWPNCLKDFTNQFNVSKMEAKARNWWSFSGNVWKYNQDHLPFLVETTSFLSAVGLISWLIAVKHSDAFLTSHHLHITIIHTLLLLSSAAEKLPFKQKQKDLSSFSKR